MERRSVASDDDGDRDLQGEQAAGVVDQAFTFDNVSEPAGKTEAPPDRRGGDGIGSANDGAEHQPFAPSEFRQDPVSGDGDAVYGKADQSEGEQRNTGEVVTKITPGGLIRRGEK